MWVWVNSGSWWWTGRPGVLRFMGSQRVGHNWATELTTRKMQSIKRSCFLPTRLAKMQKFDNFEFLCYCQNLKKGTFAIYKNYKFIYPLSAIPLLVVCPILNYKKDLSLSGYFSFFRFWNLLEPTTHVIWTTSCFLTRVYYVTPLKNNISTRLFITLFIIVKD